MRSSDTRASRSAVSSTSSRSHKPSPLRIWLPPPRTAAAMISPELVNGAKRSQPVSNCTTGYASAPSRRLLVVRTRAAQQVRAQRVRGVRADAVEVEVVLAELRGGAGADPDGRQPEHAVDRRGRDVDRADPVDRGGQHVLVEQPALQLDAAVGDAEARREVPGQAERHGHGDADHVPPPVVAAGRRARDEQAEQGRQEADHLADRVDQQHQRVQALPLAMVDQPVGVRSAVGRRAGSVTWRRPGSSRP